MRIERRQRVRSRTLGRNLRLLRRDMCSRACYGHAHVQEERKTADKYKRPYHLTTGYAQRVVRTRVLARGGETSSRLLKNSPNRGLGEFALHSGRLKLRQCVSKIDGQAELLHPFIRAQHFVDGARIVEHDPLDD